MSSATPVLEPEVSRLLLTLVSPHRASPEPPEREHGPAA